MNSSNTLSDVLSSNRYFDYTISMKDEQISFSNKSVAVLIDAENVSVKYAHSIFDELSKYGTATVKRIYGDWSSPLLKNWRENLANLAITPIQQAGYTIQKNSSDVALIIDAMDLLYIHNIDIFCIISSDSDFTRLITRLKESTKFVIGMGERKTPPALIASCNKFIYLENLDPNETEDKENEKNNNITQKKLDKKTYQLIKNFINEFSDPDGWAYLSQIGKLINDSRPDFDPRTYGSRQLNQLFKNNPKLFDIKKDEKQLNYLIRVK